MNKNKHGRIGAKRVSHAGRTRKSDAYQHAATIEETVARMPIAQRNINEAFSRHFSKGWGIKRSPGAGAQRAAERIKKMFRRHEKDSTLSSMTVAELKKVCDDRGIEYKSRAKKGDLIALLERS